MQQLLQFAPMLLIFVVLYFLMIRPQQKRQRAVREMQGALSKGDKIVTIGGLHGRVDAVEDKTFVLIIGDGTRLTFDRGAVREVLKDSEKA